MTEPTNEQRRRLGLKERDYERDEQARQRVLFWMVAVCILLFLGGLTYWMFT